MSAMRVLPLPRPAHCEFAVRSRPPLNTGPRHPDRSRSAANSQAGRTPGRRQCHVTSIDERRSISDERLATSEDRLARSKADATPTRATASTTGPAKAATTSEGERDRT